MKCETVLPLVERLADGEASLSEKTLVEDHLEGCSRCRSHYEFLLVLTRTTDALPEPPETYWERLPAKILGRVGSEPRPARAPRLWTPSVLRFGAVAATIAVVVAGGLVVLRDGALSPKEPSRPALAPAERRLSEGPSQAPAEAEVAPEPEPETSSPSIARDESPSSPIRERAKRAVGLGRRGSPGSPKEDSSPPVHDAVSPKLSARRGEIPPPREASDAEELAVRNLPEALGEADAEREYREFLRLSRAGLEGRSSFSRQAESCDPWRDYVDRYGDRPRGPDARYELARCSIRRFRADATRASKDAAIRDAESFLGIESEGPRAAEIGEALLELGSLR